MKEKIKKHSESMKAESMKAQSIKAESMKAQSIKFEKFPNPKPINIIISKETYLDNYYSKDFLKQYFL